MTSEFNGRMARQRTIFRFEGFSLQTQPDRLYWHRDKVQLTSQPLRLLQLLVTNAGTIVSHEQIRDHLWAGSLIDPSSNIHAAIKQIRHVLGQYCSVELIETIPRKGYRFVGVVCEDHSSRRARPKTMVAIGASALLLLLLIPNFIVSESFERRSTEDLYGDGVQSLFDGRFNEASKQLSEAATSDPRSAPVRVALAHAERMVGEHARALEQSEKAIRLSPASAKARYEYAMALAVSGDGFEVVERQLLLALRLDPSSHDAPIALANLTFLDGRKRAARTIIEEALARSGRAHAHLIAAAQLAYLETDLERASSFCDEALDRRPNSGPAARCLDKIAYLQEGSTERFLKRSASGLSHVRADMALLNGDRTQFRRALDELRKTDPIMAELYEIDPINRMARGKPVQPTLPNRFSNAASRSGDKIAGSKT